MQILTTTRFENSYNESKLNKNDNDHEHDASERERERFKRSTKTDRNFPKENHPAVKGRTEEAAPRCAKLHNTTYGRWWLTLIKERGEERCSSKQVYETEDAAMKITRM